MKLQNNSIFQILLNVQYRRFKTSKSRTFGNVCVLKRSKIEKLSFENTKKGVL
jgi:hypothetical protein